MDEDMKLLEQIEAEKKERRLREEFLDYESAVTSLADRNEKGGIFC